MNITPEIEQKIITALQSSSKNVDGKTVWEELITLENLYLTTKEPLPDDLLLFKEINKNS